MIGTPIQRALDVVEALTDEEQVIVVDLIRRRLIERRRDEIAANAAELFSDFDQGKAKTGTLDDLFNDLKSTE